MTDTNTPAGSDAEPDFAKMDGAELVAYVGMDAQKWAHALSVFLGPAMPDSSQFGGSVRDVLTGWFANAIASGEGFGYARGIQAGLGMAPIDFDADDIGWDSRHRPDRHADYAGEQDELGLWPWQDGYTKPYRCPHPARALIAHGVGGNVRFRKLPVEIEAVRFLGAEGGSYRFDVEQPPEWLVNAIAEPMGAPGGIWTLFADPMDAVYIGTLEGPVHLSEGDWIIQGVKGEIYPCKGDIFAATYAPAAGATEDDATRPAG